MRGQDAQQVPKFSYVGLEQRAPADHPLRAIRGLTDKALRGLSALFDELVCAGRAGVDSAEAAAAGA